MENVNREIVITAEDRDRLKKLIAKEREFGKAGDSPELKALEEELNRASVVLSEQIPPGTITMNSEFLLMDMDSGEETTYRLVYPENADFLENKISVIAPIGTAMLGYNEGDEIQWQVPSGSVHLKIKKVIYQPEAAGDFGL